MYQETIKRSNPGLIVLVLDDSGSMELPLAGSSDPKYKWVDRYTAVILRELVARSTELINDRTQLRPRYFLNAVVYGAEARLWPNPNSTEELDIGSFVQAYRPDAESEANGLGLGGKMSGTDTLQAFTKAHEILRHAVASDRFKRSFPPMLFHLTDGESQTDARDVAEEIKNLSTADGNVLIVNALIGTSTSLNYKSPDDFPGYLTEDEAGPDGNSQALWRMSSVAPESIRTNLVDDDIFPEFRSGARLYFDVRTKEMLKHVLQVVGSQGSR